jgi:hypothetical protein
VSVTDPNQDLRISALAREIETVLAERYGELLSASTITKVLAFPSVDAFRQARHRGKLPIPVFQIEMRRGYFALTKDVALWLAKQRAGVLATTEAAM